MDYATTKIVPPLAVIQPSPQYVEFPDGLAFGEINVSVEVMVIGAKKIETSGSAEAMDELLFEVINALNDEVSIVSISAPGAVNISTGSYYASLIVIEAQINLQDKEL